MEGPLVTGAVAHHLGGHHSIVLGFALLLALLDWSINHSWRATVAAGVGVLLGLGILLASWARRRRSRS